MFMGLKFYWVCHHLVARRECKTDYYVTLMIEIRNNCQLNTTWMHLNAIKFKCNHVVDFDFDNIKIFNQLIKCSWGIRWVGRWMLGGSCWQYVCLVTITTMANTNVVCVYVCMYHMKFQEIAHVPQSYLSLKQHFRHASQTSKKIFHWYCFHIDLSMLNYDNKSTHAYQTRGLKLPLLLLTNYNALRRFWGCFYWGSKMIGNMSKECLGKICGKETETILKSIKMKHINA